MDYGNVDWKRMERDSALAEEHLRIAFGKDAWPSKFWKLVSANLMSDSLRIHVVIQPKKVGDVIKKKHYDEVIEWVKETAIELGTSVSFFVPDFERRLVGSISFMFFYSIDDYKE